jgi:hypothetical protein
MPLKKLMWIRATFPTVGSFGQNIPSQVRRHFILHRPLLSRERVSSQATPRFKYIRTKCWMIPSNVSSAVSVVFDTWQCMVQMPILSFEKKSATIS